MSGAPLNSAPLNSAPALSSSAQARITRLAANPAVHRAFRWFHLQELRIRQWQHDAVSIPAPPFLEAARAAWFSDRFTELGLHEVTLDEVGNAVGYLRPPVSEEPLVLLSAHLDTVFPAHQEIHPTQNGSVLLAPGASDNGAGLAALLALAAALRSSEIEVDTNILFAANVGEEAEGNLRGMRHLFSGQAFGSRVTGSIALEGAGTATLVTRGLGSRRFRIEITGAGGHAWTDAGVPNPILALASAIDALGRLPLPARPRTTINIGQVQGGTSVTSVPQSASATVDLRSSSEAELFEREIQVLRFFEDAVIRTNAGADSARALRLRMTRIGDRPAADLRADAPLLASVRAVDRHLRLRTEERIGSTDANLPLSLGVQAIALSSGGSAGGIHTPQEWFDAAGREIALRRILLVLLDLCDLSGQADQASFPDR